MLTLRSVLAMAVLQISPLGTLTLTRYRPALAAVGEHSPALGGTLQILMIMFRAHGRHQSPLICPTRSLSVCPSFRVAAPWPVPKAPRKSKLGILDLLPNPGSVSRWKRSGKVQHSMHTSSPHAQMQSQFLPPLAQRIRLTSRTQANNWSYHSYE